MGKNGFICVDCGTNTRIYLKDYYMVTDKLWRENGVGRDMLCVGCFESRLGRKLEKEDLTPCMLNISLNPYTMKILGYDPTECRNLL